MVKQRQTNTKPWDTLEELLLASAVNRHGTTCWDSVAMELHNRCSQSPSSQDCRNKFYDLKRRFLSQNQNDDDSVSLMRMLEELRKIRVDELRRDVQRRDVLIVSLEMKVKRLEEERDRSLKEGEAAPDLDAHAHAQARKRNLPPPSGDDSDDRENRSLNESNSTSKKDDVRHNGVVQEKEKAITESVKITKKETGPLRTAAEPEREWSCAGGEPERENDAAGGRPHKRRRERERNWGKASQSQAGGIGDSNDAWESVSESKQEGKEREGASKQQISSDVQSSGSLSQRKRCRIRTGTGTGTGTGGDRGGGSSSGDDPEADALSPAKGKPSAVKSEPLLKFLEIIRSHRLGSAFERRLRSQESDRYKKLIRQHIDLRTIHSRVVKGAYADSIHRFFRDLLLLFNNAIIFFHRSSPENAAAVKLRALVLKEMKDKLRKPQPQPQPQPIVAKSKAKQEAELSSKPSTIVGCRKRDSVVLLSDVGAKKAEKNSRNVEEKPKVDHSNKATDSSEIKIYEKGTWKKGLKERPRAPPANSGPRSSSRTSTSKNNGEVKHEYGGNELSSHDGMEVRMEKKERVAKKKQGAVSFLKRMKQNSPSEAADEDGDVSEDESLKEEEEEEEEKKRTMNNKQKEGRRERATRSGGGGRGKRGVGRPPKKAEAATVKRRRQQKEEAGGGNGKPRKRSRR